MLNKLSFRLNYSEIEKRLDPIFYYKNSNLDIVNKTSLPVYKLKEVINMQRGRFGHRPRNDPSFYDGKYPFIQTGDVVRAKFGSDISYSQTLNDKGLKTSRLFSEPVVVLTIAANIGYTAILNYPACFPDSLIGLTSKNDLLELEYINIYISLIRQYIEDLAPQAAQKNINYQQLSSIPIVVPVKDVQRKIINVWNISQNLEKIKRECAREKLTSIDAYLLDKLGIHLSNKKEKIRDRIFKINFTNIIGRRLDPNAYKVDVQNLKKSIIESAFIKKPLKLLVSKGFGGNWGADVASDFDNKKFVCCTVIRATEFDNKGNLRFVNGKVKQRLIDKRIFEKSELILNDLIVEKSGGSENQPVGRIAIIDRHACKYSPLIHSNFVHKFTVVSNEITPEYLFYYLNLMHKIKLTESMQSQTNGIRNLIMSEYFSQDIIVPPLNVQEEIISHIKQIRDEAKNLEDEANQVLEHAKQEIEQMILGEVV
ncbi:hypothetical protein B9T25_02360 [Acinetobacter sp. ANC 4470]|uniref:restriction endonuclease subunit S n=1 Tax=Acinetobacter sp. ANC 4470 TaxID=1977881 RepID=UPI000A34833F|nr:restriction endonuclease subunit S [Acinetobacter sp. ANC 4470]OTG69439.1 hypothetical protein B9T25_02360 [Acinetobacter sp. ANC 4470]